MEKIKIIAIVGTDRSGSTLLDKIISSNKGMFSVGEVHRYPYYLSENHECTCGRPFHDCEFWKSVLKQLKGNAFRPELTAILGWRRRTGILLGILACGKEYTRKKFREYAIANATLLDAVRRESGANYIVDSSKDMTRIYLLHVSGLFDIYPIYITREVQDYALSLRTPQMKLDPHRETGPQKALLRWTFRNAETSFLLKACFPKFVQISYGRFVNSPLKAIHGISKELGVRFDFDPDLVQKTEYHFLGGNFMKFEKFSGIKPDTRDTAGVLDSIWSRPIVNALNHFFVRHNV